MYFSSLPFGFIPSIFKRMGCVGQISLVKMLMENNNTAGLPLKGRCV